jgi:hypothetical protein
MQQLFGEELRSARIAFDYETPRLWQITRILSEGESYIAITYHHVILDGVGGLRFAQMLLAPQSESEIADTNTGKLPVALDDTVNVKPGYLHLANVIYGELILPLFPKWLVPSVLRPTIAWPNNPVATDIAKPAVIHSQTDSQFLIISIPEHLVRFLKKAGEANGGVGIHALLSIAAMVALPKDEIPANSNCKIVTPFSDRQAELGHPYTGGNYVVAADWLHNLSISADFWKVTKAYATFLKVPRTRTMAREQWGLLDFLPEPPADNPKQHTAYDKFLLEKADSGTPYGSSFEVSNPGFIQLPKSAGIQKAAWTQPGACTGSAFSINVIGYGSDRSQTAMTLVISWLENTAPQGRLSKEQMQSFQRTYMKALEVIAGDQGPASLSIGDLQKAASAA